MSKRKPQFDGYAFLNSPEISAYLDQQEAEQAKAARQRPAAVTSAPANPSPAEPEDRTWGEAVHDTRSAISQGVGGLVGGAAWLGNQVGIGDGETAREMAGFSQYLEEEKSAKARSANRAVEKADGAAATLSALIDNPIAVADMVAKSAPLAVPGMGAAGLASRGAAALGKGLVARQMAATVAGVGAESLTSGSMAGNELYQGVTSAGMEQLRRHSSRFRELEAETGSAEQAREQLALEVSRAGALLAGAGTAAGGAIAGKVAGRLGLESGYASAVGKNVLTPAGLAKNMGREAMEEAIQSPLEDVGQGVARREADERVNPFDNIGKSALLGAVGAIGQTGATSAVQGLRNGVALREPGQVDSVAPGAPQELAPTPAATGAFDPIAPSQADLLRRAGIEPDPVAAAATASVESILGAGDPTAGLVASVMRGDALQPVHDLAAVLVNTVLPAQSAEGGLFEPQWLPDAATGESAAALPLPKHGFDSQEQMLANIGMDARDALQRAEIAGQIEAAWASREPAALQKARELEALAQESALPVAIERAEQANQLAGALDRAAGVDVPQPTAMQLALQRAQRQGEQAKPEENTQKSAESFLPDSASDVVAQQPITSQHGIANDGTEQDVADQAPNIADQAPNIAKEPALTMQQNERGQWIIKGDMAQHAQTIRDALPGTKLVVSQKNGQALVQMPADKNTGKQGKAIRKALDHLLLSGEQLAARDQQRANASERAKAANRQAQQIDPERDDIVNAVAKLGGIDTEQALSEWWRGQRETIGHYNGEVPGNLRRQGVFAFKRGGMAIDDMVRRLEGEGYLPQGSTPNDLLDAIEQRQLHPAGMERQAQEAFEARQQEEAPGEFQQAYHDGEFADDFTQRELEDNTDYFDLNRQQREAIEAADEEAKSRFWSDAYDGKYAFTPTEEQLDDIFGPETAKPAETAAGTNDAGAATASAQGVQPDGEAEGAQDGFGLTSYTAGDLQRQAQEAERQQRELEQQRAAADKARQDEETRKEIRRRSEAAADTFVLGGNAEDNLTGQGGLFDAPTESSSAQNTADSPENTAETPQNAASKAEIVAAIDALIATGERRRDAGESPRTSREGLAYPPPAGDGDAMSTMNWLSDAERQQLHDLKQSLPSAASEREAARARIQDKISQRKSRMDGGALESNEPKTDYTDYYETDLFGNPLPDTGRKARATKPAQPEVRRNVLAAPSVQGDTPAPDGDYKVRTIVGSESQRKLGARSITSVADLAAATSYLYRSAVERFDAIVTDASGKPLAVIGAFKGAIDQTSVYPATLVGEAVRIPGAAHIWFSHNHPSGTAKLSDADRFLYHRLADIFDGSGITPMGLIAVANRQYASMEDGHLPIPQSSESMSVPVVERELSATDIDMPAITSPQAAKELAGAMYKGSEYRPGMMLLNTQNQVAAWVPLPATAMGALRHSGGLNAIYRAISESNAGAVILVHGGELSERIGGVTLGQNIAAAVAKLDVRPLDIIDIRKRQSAAEAGELIQSGPVYSKANDHTNTQGMSAKDLQAIIAKALPAHLRERVKVAQSRSNNAQQSARSEDNDLIEAEYDPATGQLTLYADAIPTPERALFVLPHELTHYGLDAKYGFGLSSILLEARNNPMIARLAAAIAVDRKMTVNSVRQDIADARGVPVASVARSAAVHRLQVETANEALAELNAAIERNDFAYLQDRYGVAVPKMMRNDLRGRLLRLAASVKAWMAKLTGKQATDYSDKQVWDLLAGVREHVKTESSHAEQVAGNGTLNSTAKKDDFSIDKEHAAAFWKLLGTSEDTFRHGKPDAFELGDIAQQIDPGMSVHDATNLVSPGKRRAESIVQMWMVSMPDGKAATVTENKRGDIWIDASSLEKGQSGGSKLYAAVASYAAANGKVFIGDPAGLSEAALVRRTEQMLSSAIKEGTTRHLMPHPRQMDPAGYDANSKVNEHIRPINWVPGDDTNNLHELLQSSYHNVRKLVPNIAKELDHVRYNFDAGRFERDGKPVEPGFFNDLANEASIELTRRGLLGLVSRGAGNSGRQGQGAVIGSSTLERAVITASVTRAAREGTWREVLARLGEHLSGNKVNPGFHGKLYSTAQKPASAGFSLSEETRAKAAQRKGQDNMNRWKQVLGEIQRQGGAVDERNDVYGAEERFHGRAATQIEDFARLEVEPLLQRLADSGHDLEEVEEFLLAQHAEEANAAIREIDPGRDTAYGIEDAEAQALLARYQSMPDFTRFEALANDFRRIADGTLELYLRAGIISQDAAAAMRATYQFYVPVKGGDEDQAARQGTGKGLSVNGKQKRRMGHDRREENVLENLLRDRERAIILAEKNNVGTYLLDLVQRNPDPKLWTVGVLPKQKVLRDRVAYVVQHNGQPAETFADIAAAEQFIDREVLRGAGQAKDFNILKTRDPYVTAMAKPMLQENEVQVYVQGQPLRIQLHDPVLVGQYRRMGTEMMGSLVEAGKALNRWLSKVYTGYNPEFFVRNVARDLTAGMINLTADQGAKVATKALVHWPKAGAAMFRYALTGEAPNGEYGRALKRYRAAGGSTGAAYMGDLERQADRLTRLYDDCRGAMSALKDGKPGKAAMIATRKLVGGLAHWFEVWNQAGENAFRLATFMAMEESGKGVAQAASMAKNVTVNFNRKGELTPQLGAAYLFLNPSVQGTARLWQSLFGKDTPHKAQAWAMVGSMVGLALALAAMNRADDDDEWEATPDSVKDRNLLVPLGNGRKLTIPLPYGYSFFVSMANRLDAVMHGESTEKAGIRIASALFENFSPVGNPIGDNPDSKNLINMMPTAAKIVLQPAANITDFGGPMRPEYDQNQPDNEKMWRGTRGGVYDQAAQFVSDRVGSKYENDWADISPETLKYLVRTFTGGTGAFMADSASLLNVLAAGAEPDLAEVPFARSGARDMTVKDLRARFNELGGEARQHVDAWKRAVKAGDDAEATRYEQDGAMMAMGELMEGYAKQARTVRDLMAAELRRDDLSLAAKRALQRRHEADEAAVYQEFIREFRH